MFAIPGYRLDTPIDPEAILRWYEGVRRVDGREAPARVAVCPPPVSPARLEALRPLLEASRSLGERGPASLLDYGLTEDGYLYVALPPEPHMHLAKLVAGGALPVELAAQLGADVASEMAKAHAAQPPLVHGAMHPRAVLIDRAGVAHLSGHVVLRLALLLSEDQTGLLFHVAPYLAPEMVMGTEYEPAPAMDVFALASLIYEAVTGEAAFRGETPLATTLKIRMTKVPPLDAVREQSPELAALLERMWSVEPSARPTAAAAGDELRALAGRESDNRRALGERGFGQEEPAPAVSPAPAPAEHGAHVALDDDPTDLSVRLPNHVPSNVSIPLARGDTAEMIAGADEGEFFEPTAPLIKGALYGAEETSTLVSPTLRLGASSPPQLSPRREVEAPTAPPVDIRRTVPDLPPVSAGARGPARRASGGLDGTKIAILAAAALSFVVLAVLLAVWIAS